MSDFFQAYAERSEAPPDFADRLAERLIAGFRRWSGGETRRDADAGFAAIRQMAEQRRGTPLAEQRAALRYRLHRDGYSDQLIVECLALCTLGLAEAGLPAPTAIACAAARQQLQGHLVAVSAADDRLAALALAVTAATLCGDPVHLLAPGEARAGKLAGLVSAYGKPLGISVAVVGNEMDFSAKRAAYAADVVCSTVLATGLDYLRDRLALGARQGRLATVASRLAGDLPAAERLLLRGLHWVFVDDAELVMIDDARLPLVISTEVSFPGERLLYEQAMELALALAQDVDFAVVAGSPELTDDGRQRLARLVSPLGGVWAARRRSEELIGIALRALHEFQRDRDYRVLRGRVIFAPVAGAADQEPSEGDQILQRLTEVKEGCTLTGRREVLGRVSVPRFLNRYLRLAGVCTDPSDTAAEFWSIYGRRLNGEVRSHRPLPLRARVFASAPERLAAVLRHVGGGRDGGYSTIVCVSTPAAAQGIGAALAEAGLPAGVLRGSGDAADQQALSSLDSPGAVVLACHPAERNVGRSPSAVPLHLLVPELLEAPRQLGTLGRVYAATRGEQLLALDDEMVDTLTPGVLADWLRRRTGTTGELPAMPARWLARWLQAGMHREQRIQREELLSRDVYLAASLAFSGRQD